MLCSTKQTATRFCVIIDYIGKLYLHIPIHRLLHSTVLASDKVTNESATKQQKRTIERALSAVVL